MKEYWLGLDIGGTKCAVLLATVDQGIRIEDKIRFASETEQGFHHTYGMLCEAIADMMVKHLLTAAQINAIGVSCGGPLDSRRGVVLCPPNLPGWVDIPLTQMLEERFGIPVYLQNDANACALVEWKLGAGRGVDDMIFLTMGTGLGGGIIAEGRLLRGANDMGGEFGHLRLTPDGPIGFGKAGSFEGYASGGGIARQAQALTRRLLDERIQPAWIQDGCSVQAVDAKMMADAARRGDKHALRFWDDIGRMLGQGLALLVDAFNPARIIIGSVFLRCEDLLRPAMERELQKEALAQALAGVSVLPAETGERLGDFASIMVGLYACNIDPMQPTDERKPAVLWHYERLFTRYPALEGCREQIMQAYLLLRNGYLRGGKLMVMGNGGSCADSAHITGELMKGFHLTRPLNKQQKTAIAQMTEDLLSDAASLLQQGLPALELGCHTALTTAVANDQSALLTGAQQVVALAKSGDVLLGISTSGNSKNIALAIATAKALGVHTIGLTGKDGGTLKALCDCMITVPADTTADIQEYHLPVYHTLCSMLESYFFE